MRIQIIHNKNNFFRIWILFREQPFNLLSPVFSYGVPEIHNATHSMVLVNKRVEAVPLRMVYYLHK